MKKIPIKEAQIISEEYGYERVFIICLSDNENQDGWVTTYNKDKSKCKLLGGIGCQAIRLIRAMYNFPETIEKWKLHFDSQDAK